MSRSLFFWFVMCLFTWANLPRLMRFNLFFDVCDVFLGNPIWEMITILVIECSFVSQIPCSRAKHDCTGFLQSIFHILKSFLKGIMNYDQLDVFENISVIIIPKISTLEVLGEGRLHHCFSLGVMSFTRPIQGIRRRKECFSMFWLSYCLNPFTEIDECSGIFDI